MRLAEKDTQDAKSVSWVSVSFVNLICMQAHQLSAQSVVIPYQDVFSAILMQLNVNLVFQDIN